MGRTKIVKKHLFFKSGLGDLYREPNLRFAVNDATAAEILQIL